MTGLCLPEVVRAHVDIRMERLGSVLAVAMRVAFATLVGTHLRSIVFKQPHDHLIRRIHTLEPSTP